MTPKHSKKTCSLAGKELRKNNSSIAGETLYECRGVRKRKKPSKPRIQKGSPHPKKPVQRKYGRKKVAKKNHNVLWGSLAALTTIGIVAYVRRWD